jgi:hypothetical protein
MYDFTLELPDGRCFSVSVPGETWRWHTAFSEACRSVESLEGLPERSGIRCIDYSWHLAEAIETA